MHPDWYFPPNHGGEESGLNDAGIEFFRTSGSLARETVQNSGDASDTSGLPVRIVFCRSFVPAADFPGAHRFREVIQACRDYALTACKTSEERAQNGEAFFDRALTLLGGAGIPFLFVSDFNTTGLVGGDGDPMSPWYRLIRKQGSASLHGAGGGTFGIGQRAPFASSELRTVFYATRTGAGDASLIGKSILSTFQQADGTRYRNVGYFGLKRPNELVEPIRGLTGLPAIPVRHHVGTDLVIAGFSNDDWLPQVGRAVVRNFFAAIHDGGLEVELREEGQPPSVITRDTLEEYIESLLGLERARAARLTKAEAREIETELTATQHYISAMTTPHGGEPFRKTLPKLGEVRLYVTVADAAPSRVAYMRRPRILVYDRGHRASLQGYAAVMICDSVEGSALLARLEDPSHTKWDRERVKGGGAILATIYAFVRDSLSAIASTAATEAQDIPDLGRFLPEDDAPQGGGPSGANPTENHTSEETPRKQQQRAVIRKPSRPVPPQAAIPGDPTNGGGAEDVGTTGAGSVAEGGDGPGGGEEPGAGAGPLGGEMEVGRSLTDSDIGFRSYFDAKTSSFQLVVWSRADGLADLSLSEVGETGTYPLELLLAVDRGTGAAVPIEGSILRRIQLTRGKRRHFELRARNEAKTALSLEIRNAR
jgi:hypothetical protein